MNSVAREILIDDNHAVFSREGMFFKEFPSDLRKIRYYTLLVVQKAPLAIKELNLLEQQISEIIKNAVKHGNKSDATKNIKIWYKFSEQDARIIVEDEGSGFSDIEKWNAFNGKRVTCVSEGDYDKLADFVSWRSSSSDDTDGGNALFAAVEYWNGGYIFNSKRNCVGALKVFPANQPLFME